MQSGEHGVILVDGICTVDTKQCCHCGGHFISYKGSGKRRMYCAKCDAITCGEPGCDECIPFERQLLIMEGKGNGVLRS